jgi:hypothetical protein
MAVANSATKQLRVGSMQLSPAITAGGAAAHFVAAR